MSSANESISPDEVKEFLESTLQLQLSLVRLGEDRAGFLRDVISRCLERIPFQSLTGIATPKPERRALTFPEIKTDMMTRQGGLCCELNYFLKVLLETLGFEIYYIGCTVYGILNNHLSTIVKNLSRPGDLHLVDIGTGNPTFEPIPLDFDSESPLYKTSYLHHKFLKNSEGTYQWMHRIRQDCHDGPPLDAVDEWYTFMVFDLESRDIEYFAPNMECIRTVESGPNALTPFLLSLRAVDFRNGRLFAIKDTTILEEDESGKVNKKRISSLQELLEAYKVHFPQFPAEIIQRATQTVELIFQKSVWKQSG